MMDNSYDSEGFWWQTDRWNEVWNSRVTFAISALCKPAADTNHCCSSVNLYKYLPAKRDSFSFRIEEVACANMALILLMAET